MCSKLVSGNKCFKCKLVLLGISGSVFLGLFIVSLCIDYRLELSKEHLRFRKGFISQHNWLDSPKGQLHMYLFNVTNAEAFLSGNDTRIRVQEIGPIVYRIRGRNEVINQTDDTLIYRRIRYDQVEFDPEASCSPDILNQTVILPNLVLLGAAAKLHDWVFLVRHAFNAITINESVFLTQSVYYFLWDFTVPALKLLSNYVPNIVSNCGLLFNAMRQRDEVFNVRIGVDNGFENFFRVNDFNGYTYFPEQKTYLNLADDMVCPINLEGTFDNSLFPPYLDKEQELNIIAVETCRTMRMYYDGPTENFGFPAYRYVMEERNEQPSCLDSSMGIKLHKGMFDVSKCLINDVPSAFSAPHFLGSSYNYSEHFEGMSPDAERHQAHIIMEPITGVPLIERYRFQSNIPMPDMAGYNRNLQRLSNVVVPNFWYEYVLDEYPPIVMIPLRLNAKLLPVLQPIFIVLFFCIAVLSFLKLYLLIKQKTFKEVFCKYYIMIKEFRTKT